MGEPFIKLHGLGNDFLVVDRRATGELPSPSQAVTWCDRHRGVGADGVLTLLPSNSSDARMHITNADGSVAEMCGNGLRCVAKVLGDRASGLGEVRIDTDAGVRACALVREGGQVVAVTCEMGAPLVRFVRSPIELDGEELHGTALSLGNPHLVLWDTPPERAAMLGPLLERHRLFPQRTNVAFVRPGTQPLEVVVWERGCGLTQACGTGACAAVVAGIALGHLRAEEEIAVRLPGGVLTVKVAPDLSQVWMRGEAVEVFRGLLT